MTMRTPLAYARGLPQGAKRRAAWLLLIAGLALYHAGCSNTLPGPYIDQIPDAGANADLPTSNRTFELRLVPGDLQQLTSTDGKPVTVSFKAYQVYKDNGEQVEVTDRSFWGATAHDGQRVALGSINRGVFTTNESAGTGVVSAEYLGQRATTPVSLKLTSAHLSTADDKSNPPPGAAMRFTGAEVSSKAPRLLYPQSGATLPQNLGALEVQWAQLGGADLFEVAITGTWLDLRIYTTSTRRLTLSDQEYNLLVDAGLYGPVGVRVRGGNQTGAATYGVSEQAQLLVTPAISGGLYYFAARPAGQTQPAQGIWRYNLLAGPTAPAKAYATDATAGLVGKCAGCHSLTADGRTLAYSTSQVSAQQGGVIDVGNGLVRSIDSGAVWASSILTTSAAGDQVLGAGANQLRLFGADLGRLASTLSVGVAPGTTASQPSISADGKRIVFVRGTVRNGTSEVQNLELGNIMVMDAQAGVFGAPSTLVAVQGATQNNYYPTLTPDGVWVLFTRAASGPSYDNALAELWAVKADGSLNPVRLASASTPVTQQYAPVALALSNSWPRLNPQPVQVGGKTIYYFTFSSRREYGVEVTRAGGDKTSGTTSVLAGTGASLKGWTNQIWMSTFDPELAAKGQDPSSAAIWVPTQSVLTSNHTATWTLTYTGADLN